MALVELEIVQIQEVVLRYVVQKNGQTLLKTSSRYYVRKANKYWARKTVFNGRKYDSKHEAGIAAEVDLLRRLGEVVKVEPQKTFALYGRGGCKICTHRPDFLLTFRDGHQEVWEAKGFPAPVSSSS